MFNNNNSQDKRLHRINSSTYEYDGKIIRQGNHIALEDNKKPISPFNASKALDCLKGPVKLNIIGQLRDVSYSSDVLLHALEASQKYKDELVAVSHLTEHMAKKVVANNTGE